MAKRPKIEITGNAQPAGEPAAEWVDTASLVPWDRNPRRNDENVARVAKSIKRFGFASPIIARTADRTIIAGHTRWKAAQSLGLERVPVRFLDLDPADAQLLALADNRLNELSPWDDAQLQRILGEHGLEDVELAGWSAEDLERMASELLSAAADGVEEPEDVEPPAVSVTRPGDRIELGRHVLVCGDSCDPSVMAAALAGRRYDVVVLDPPFEHDRLYHLHDPTVLFGQAKHLRMVPDELWRFERVVDKVTAHRSATTQVGHRHAFVAQVGSVKKLPDDAGTYPSVITVEERPNHPHEKPVSLVVEHLTRWTPPWELVFDPFAGSGTTLLAAEHLGKACVCIEMDPARCDVIVARWEKLTGGEACRPPRN